MTERRIGLLVVNLGTPDAPTPRAVKTYLREFLSDPRVVEIPAFVWQPILRGIILNVRPAKSARAYREIWLDDGSPLAVHSREIAEALDGLFGADVVVDWAMRYGRPAIAARLQALVEAGCDRIVVLPLYPQYCAATTASVTDAIGTALARLRHQPSIRTVAAYHDDPAYIAAIAQSTRTQIAALPFVPDRLLASFHGMPERTRALGDPYHDECVETARLLADALGRPIDVSFQSRFGRAKWLEPSTDTTLRRLGAEGVGSLAVITPGFATDCLETLEEIGMRGREAFLSAGGGQFALLRCLNAESDAISLYRTLISREIRGWQRG